MGADSEEAPDTAPDTRNKFEDLGFMAAFMTTVAFWPQAFTALHSNEVESLSLATYTTYSLGLMLWVAYAFLADLRPSLYSALFSLLPAVLITYAIAKKRRRIRNNA